ncbi:hypothetical protein Ddc_19770 [Ditylenchus destructor]|nr:hypothetical protein Ddc_19770 [Ditylenchus destructor]
MAARQLNQDGAHAARSARDQQADRALGLLLHLQAVEQQFPGGDGGQRQRGGFGVAQRRGRLGGDAVVHALELRVAARAGDVARVPDPVADGEALHLGSDRAHGADRVPAQDHRRAAVGAGGRTRILVSTGFTATALISTAGPSRPASAWAARGRSAIRIR